MLKAQLVSSKPAGEIQKLLQTCNRMLKRQPETAGGCIMRLMEICGCELLFHLHENANKGTSVSEEFVKTLSEFLTTSHSLHVKQREFCTRVSEAVAEQATLADAKEDKATFPRTSAVLDHVFTLLTTKNTAPAQDKIAALTMGSKMLAKMIGSVLYKMTACSSGGDVQEQQNKEQQLHQAQLLVSCFNTMFLEKVTTFKSLLVNGATTSTSLLLKEATGPGMSEDLRLLAIKNCGLIVNLANLVVFGDKSDSSSLDKRKQVTQPVLDVIKKVLANEKKDTIKAACVNGLVVVKTGRPTSISPAEMVAKRSKNNGTTSSTQEKQTSILYDLSPFQDWVKENIIINATLWSATLKVALRSGMLSALVFALPLEAAVNLKKDWKKEQLALFTDATESFFLNPENFKLNNTIAPQDLWCAAFSAVLETAVVESKLDLATRFPLTLTKQSSLQLFIEPTAASLETSSCTETEEGYIVVDSEKPVLKPQSLQKLLDMKTNPVLKQFLAVLSSSYAGNNAQFANSDSVPFFKTLLEKLVKSAAVSEKDKTISPACKPDLDLLFHHFTTSLVQIFHHMLQTSSEKNSQVLGGQKHFENGKLRGTTILNESYGFKRVLGRKDFALFPTSSIGSTSSSTTAASSGDGKNASLSTGAGSFSSISSPEEGNNSIPQTDIVLRAIVLDLLSACLPFTAEFPDVTACLLALAFHPAICPRNGGRQLVTKLVEEKLNQSNIKSPDVFFDSCFPRLQALALASEELDWSSSEMMNFLQQNPLRIGAVRAITSLYKPSARNHLESLMTQVKLKMKQVSDRINLDSKSDAIAIFFQDESEVFHSEYNSAEDSLGLAQAKIKSADLDAAPAVVSVAAAAPKTTAKAGATGGNKSAAAPKSKAKAKAAPAKAAAAGPGTTMLKNKGALSKEEQNEMKLLEQLQLRQRMRYTIQEAELLLDLFSSFSFIPQKSQTTSSGGTISLLEKHVPELLPSLVILLGSPLTALSTVARIRSFVQSVVPKQVISTRCLLPDILQLVARNEIARDVKCKHVKPLPLVDIRSAIVSAVGEGDSTSEELLNENTTAENEQEGSENSNDRQQSQLLTLLHGVSHENPLTAGGFSFLVPVLIQILQEADSKSESLCSLALQILARQLSIVSETQLTLLTTEIRMNLLEGLFSCIYKLPRIAMNCKDTLEVICKRLVATEKECKKLARMYLQCSEKARKVVLLPGIAALLQNYYVMKTTTARQAFHAVLLIGLCESAGSGGGSAAGNDNHDEDDGMRNGNTDGKNNPSSSDQSLAAEIYESFGLTDSLDATTTVLPDLLEIIKGILPAPIVEAREIQKLGGLAMLKLLELVQEKQYRINTQAKSLCKTGRPLETNEDYVRNAFDILKQAYTSEILKQQEFYLNLKLKKDKLAEDKKAAVEAKKFLTGSNAPKSALEKEIEELDEINRKQYWTAKYGLVLLFKHILSHNNLVQLPPASIADGTTGEDFLRFLLHVALHDDRLQDLEVKEKSTIEDVRSVKKDDKKDENKSSPELEEIDPAIQLFGDLRELLIASGTALIEVLGESQGEKLAKIVDELEIAAITPEGSQLGSAVFSGALGKFLNPNSDSTRAILPRLFTQCLDAKSSNSVQLAVVKVLPPLIKMQLQVEKNAKLTSDPDIPLDSKSTIESKLLDLLDVAFTDKVETVRRGAALALGAVVKGLSIQTLKQFDIMSKIEQIVNGKQSNSQAKQGAIMCLEGLTRSLGRLFEPYVIATLPILLKAFADSAPIVRTATQSTAKAIMGNLSAHGVKLVLPHLLEGIDDKQWRTKLASIEMLASMVQGAPKQLAVSLPKVVPVLAEVVNDTHAKVKDAAKLAMERVGQVISNPEIRQLAPQLLTCLSTVTENSTRKALDSLLTTSFVHNVDAPSLALLCPLVLRALRERSAEMKRKGAQIIGSMVLLIKEPKDIQPHLPVLLPALKITLVDPIPDVRATSAKAFGTLAQGLPEELLGDLLPWLFTMLKSKESPVERSGAAHGLSEVLMALGANRVDAFLPDLLETAAAPNTPPEVKEGYLGLFVYLPLTMGGKSFEKWFQRALDGLLRGMQEEYQTVRDVAFRAASSICKQFGATYTALILPPLEEGLFEVDYRIRHASVLLLMNVIESVLKANRMNTNNVDLMSAEVMPPERRAYVLSSLYIVRSDESGAVKHAATSAWKQLVQNTPRCVRELLPILMRRLIHLLASASKEKQVCASRCVGELVGKLGDRVLPELMPIFFKALTTDGSTELVREGVCIGLTELINNCSRQLLVDYVSELVPAVRQALCDNSESVRNAASKVAALLYSSVGTSATNPIITGLLKGLSKGDTRCLDGLEQLLQRQSNMVLPVILETLPKAGPPWQSAAQLYGLSTLSKLEDEHLFYRHITDVLEPILETLASEDQADFIDDAVEAGRKLLQKVTSTGSNIILGELGQCLSSKRGRMRAAGGILLRVFFEETNAEMPSIMDLILDTLLPIAVSDPDEFALKENFKAFQALTKMAKKEDQSLYLEQVRELILKEASVTDKSGTKSTEQKGMTLPGLALPNGLEPFYPIYQHGLMYGSNELRLLAAKGLGELVDHTTEAALKPYVVKITGPLIRIVGDRFPPNVRIAILETLELLLKKGGASLRPFLPQLQTTYLKCLTDATSGEVRSKAAESLGVLVVLNPRTDSLLQELANNLSCQASGAANCSPEKQDGYRQALACTLDQIPADKLKDPVLQKVKDAVQAAIDDHGAKDDVFVEECSKLLRKKWTE
ncbi:unnamed protein product [Amoebophrya sp. A120]|nr:unnamed protein product [Amoebophrya sp. A120]|eukprot:GSA120T00016059001.1